MYIALIYLAIFLVFAILLQYRLQRTEERSNAMAQAAKTLGLSFRKTPTATELNAVLCSSSRQNRQKGANLMIGARQGFAVAILDATPYKGRGQTMIAVYLGSGTLPDFRIYPKNTVRALFSDTMTVDKPRDFAKQHDLLTRDTDTISAILTPQWLGAFVDHPGFQAEGSGERLLFYWQNTLIAPETVGACIDYCVDLAAELQGALTTTPQPVAP